MTTVERSLPFRLPASALRDLAHLTDVATNLNDFAEVAASLISTVPFQDYAQAISRRLNLKLESVSTTINALSGLRRLQQAFDLPEGELVERLTASLLKDASDGWKAKYLDRWKGSCHLIAEVLRQLTADHPLALLWKSESLATAHENIFGESAILTDIRPVFNQSGEKVLQTIVSHVLLIDYFSGNERKRIQFMLDAADVAALKNACDRSRQKTESIRVSLAQLNWPTSVLSDTSP